MVGVVGRPQGYGGLGASEAGKARAEKLTPEQRKESTELADHDPDQLEDLVEFVQLIVNEELGPKQRLTLTMTGRVRGAA